MRVPIGRKLIVANALLLIPLLIGLNFVVINLFEQFTLRKARDLVESHSYTAQLQVSRSLSQSEQILNNDLFFLGQELSKRMGVRFQIYFRGDSESVFIDSFSREIISAYNPIGDEGLILAANHQKKSYIVETIDAIPILNMSFPIFRVNELVGAGKIMYSLEREYALVSGLRIILLLMNSLLFIVITVGLVTVTTWIVAPLVKLKEKILSFSVDGSIGEFVSSPIKDEVYDLDQAFTTMGEQIQQLFAGLQDEKGKQKKFMDNMTHEFKTPLANILGYADLADRLYSDEKHVEYMALIKSEGDRLLRLVNELLDRSRLNAYTMSVEPKLVDLTALLDDVLIMLKGRLQKSGIRINKAVEKKIIINIDEDRFTELILNILDNAIKHSETKSIDIALYKQDSKIMMSFRDFGVGYEPELRRGHGLGIGISRQIVELHGGSFQILPKNPGCLVLVSLPLAKVGCSDEIH